jgi:glycine/D-amino acid oxidase-like deaminating enzyme
MSNTAHSLNSGSGGNGHYSVLVVGGGQAGLSISYYLKQAGVDHLVLEKQTARTRGASSVGTHSVSSRRTGNARCLATPTRATIRTAS